MRTALPRATCETMNVPSAPELEHFVAVTVASGRYGIAGEVVRAALRLQEKAEQGRLRPAPERDKERRCGGERQ